MANQEREEVARALRGKSFSGLTKGRTRGVYQFFSFDLVNSTLFKSQHPDIWPIVVTRFYELLESILNTSTLAPRLWKYVGDEILFYKRVHSVDQIIEALSIAVNALRATEAALHTNHPQSKEFLAIKGSTWLALAEYVPPSAIEQLDSNVRNIVIATGRRPDLSERDFLGPDIDIGFRISRHSLRHRLVVSANLAAVICGTPAASRLQDNFRIITLERLKGVWGDRLYPIIWFEENWETVGQSFLYDELLVSPLAKQALEVSGRAEKGLGAVPKIFEDLGKTDEIEEIRSLLSVAEPDETPDTEVRVPIFKYAEVHCAAACFSKDGRVLAAKRLSTKRRYPDAYEFGCGQLKLGESFAECLRRSYREDFGVNITIPDLPVPASTYVIHDNEEDRNIPGIIFAARIQDAPETVMANYVREKHQSIRWFTPDELPDDNTGFVPRFAQTARLALALLQSEQES